MKSRQNTNVRALCESAMIAALYVVLTEASALVGLASSVPQCRLSEALCVLPLFFPSSVAGLTLGCFLANLLTGALLPDLLFGTLATLLGAIGARFLRTRLGTIPNGWKIALATLPNIVSNTVVIPLVLRTAYHLEGALWLLFVEVAAGEILSSGVLGTLVGLAVRRWLSPAK